MALTYTPTNELNTPCPDFTLPAVDGKTYSLNHFADKKVLVIMFICNHCPYVQAIEDRILQLHNFFSKESVQLLGICSNDSTDYPEDSFDGIRSRWQEKAYGFPYLYDEDQVVAKKFDAICTPDIFLFNSKRNLVYRGRLDDSWKDATKVQKEELKIAIQDTLADQEISITPHPSMGCSIKWKA